MAQKVRDRQENTQAAPLGADHFRFSERRADASRRRRRPFDAGGRGWHPVRAAHTSPLEPG